jgi:penicillin V acylase-like amidase (Ntn superfamily)
VRRARAAVLFGALAALGLWPRSLPACTTFCLIEKDVALFGRNYDFEIGDGLIIVNPRGLSKRSLRAQNPARWVSRHASLTFNQYGRDFPTGGMNEAGLVVELMWLDATRYPAEDGRPSVGVLEWIQMQLDTRGSVAELLAHAGDARIDGRAPLHYLVADPSGAAATVEFLDGRLVVHTGPELPVRALANDTYAGSLEWVRSGGSASGTGSRQRFARAASMLEERSRRPAGDPVQAAFGILEAVSQGRATRWSIVYDMARRVARFRTGAHRPVRSVALDRLARACGEPALMLDANAPLEGDVTGDFVPWTPEANLALVAGSYAQVSFLMDTPRGEIEAVAAHAAASTCSP